MITGMCLIVNPWCCHAKFIIWICEYCVLEFYDDMSGNYEMVWIDVMFWWLKYTWVWFGECCCGNYEEERMLMLLLCLEVELFMLELRDTA